MVILFILGGLELFVGMAMGYYPSIIMASCLLCGAFALKLSIKKRREELKALAEAEGYDEDDMEEKKDRSAFKKYLVTTALFIGAALFIFSSIVSRTFPGLAVGVFFIYFGLKKMKNEA